MNAVVFLLCVCLAPVPPEAKKEVDPFQGTWEVVKFEAEGQNFEGLTGTAVFEANKYSFTTGEAVEKGTFTLDPKAKTPSVDFTIVEGGGKGKKQLGIYKIDGDTLTLCLAKEGAETRPTKFMTAAGATEHLMVTLKRKKK